MTRPATLYPRYIEGNPDASSFPSQSTTLYAAVAAGIYSLHKWIGWLLWLGVVFLVGLPRIYLGGHYPSDVLVGAILGIVGYAAARYFLESNLVLRVERVFRGPTWLQVLGEVIIFCWIWQVAVGFREISWINNSLRYLIRDRSLAGPFWGP